jgi:hypothetical protein
MSVSGAARAAALALFGATLAPGAAVAGADEGCALVATLDAAQEVPAPVGVPPTASGTGAFVFDPRTGTLAYDVTVHDLTGAPIGAHVHRSPPGVPGAVLVPLDHTTLRGVTPRLTAARIAPLLSGDTYVNVHTARNTSGEIRGQITVDYRAGAVAVEDCGDVTGDRVVDVRDALQVAQFGVGLRGCGEAPFTRPEACDVNPQPTPARPDLVPDGRCDIGDALRMAQCSVGLVPCDFLCEPFVCPGVTTTTTSTTTSTTLDRALLCGGSVGPPFCLGFCPPERPICAEGSGGCVCVAGTTPCGSARSPECDGVCAAGLCLPVGAGCGCFDGTLPCNQLAFPTCNGECPADHECVAVSVPDGEGCICVPAGSTCWRSYPTCGGTCPDGRTCGDVGIPGLCFCQ